MKNLSKAFASVVLILVLIVGSGLTFVGCFGPGRDNTLRLANWNFFLCPDLKAEFQTYWREYTGNSRFTVVEENFSSNSELHNMMTIGGGDFDLVVPSDYMVERLIAENRLQALDMSLLGGLTRNTGTTAAPNYQFDPSVIDANITSRIPRGSQGQHFAVPYLYGTMGIIVDTRVDGLLSAVEHYGWASLWNSVATLTPSWTNFLERNQMVSTKEIGRENFAIAQMVLNRTELLALSGAALTTRVQELMGAAPDTQFLTEMEALLNQLPGNTFWEVGDDTLERFMEDSAEHVMGAEWSVSAGFVMRWSDEYIEDHSSNFQFVIPREGTNLWINNLVIPTGARQVTAAHGFIEWISRPENAVRNMDFTMTSTPIIEATTELYEYFTEESEWFAGQTPAWQENFLRMLFPSSRPDIFARAGVFRHFPGTSSVPMTALDDLITRVRG